MKEQNTYNWALLEYEFVTDPDCWSVKDFFMAKYQIDPSLHGWIKSKTIGWAKKKKLHWDKIVAKHRSKLEKEFEIPVATLMKGKKRAVEAMIDKLNLSIKVDADGNTVDVDMEVKDIDKIKNSLKEELGEPSSRTHSIISGPENGEGKYEGISFVIMDANEIKKKTENAK